MYHALMSRLIPPVQAPLVRSVERALSPEFPTDTPEPYDVSCISIARVRCLRPPRGAVASAAPKVEMIPFRITTIVLRMPQQRVPHPPVRTRASAALSHEER